MTSVVTDCLYQRFLISFHRNNSLFYFVNINHITIIVLKIRHQKLQSFFPKNQEMQVVQLNQKKLNLCLILYYNIYCIKQIFAQVVIFPRLYSEK